MKRPLALVAVLLAFALVASGCGGGGSVGSSTLNDAATITYTLKGEKNTLHVSNDRLLAEVGYLVKNAPFAKFLKDQKFAVNENVTVDSRITAIWLTQLIQQETIDSLYESRDLHVSSALRAAAKTDAAAFFPGETIFPAFSQKFQNTLTDRQARSEALLASYTDTSEAAAKAYFKEHESEFGCASGRDVSHILVATQAEALALLDQLDAGASFATLARANSTDTQSGQAGGALGCLTPGAFVPEFETAATKAPLGVPTGPVKTQFGYHIILATKAAPTTFESVRTQVLQALQQKGSSDLSTTINGLFKRFHVKVNKRYGTWGLTTNSQGQSAYTVTAPTPPAPATAREGTTTTTLPVVPGGTP